MSFSSLSMICFSWAVKSAPVSCSDAALTARRSDAGVTLCGTVQLTPQSVTPASLRLVVKAASLHETGADFTDQQKQIIDKELKDIVLHPDQYPDIVFQSTNVTARPAKTGGGYDVRLIGDLTLHGTTRRIEIPATVTLNGDEMRAVGKFSIDRDDYKVKATSAFHGMVRVDDDVKFEFDIVGKRQ